MESGFKKIDLANYRENKYQNAGINITPCYGEDGVFREILRVIGDASNNHVVEFGELRVLGTTTRYFRIAKRSKAIYFSSSYDFKSKYLNIFDICKLTFKTKDVRYLKFLFNMPFQAYASTENITKLLKEHGLSNEFLCLTIDVDSYDYDLAKVLLSSGFRPKILVLEYNPSLGNLSIKLKDQSGYSINKRIYGASAISLISLAESFGYKLIHVSGFCNLIFVEEWHSINFVCPNIDNEITGTEEKIREYINQYCLTDFEPSWMHEPELSDKHLETYFEKV